jgi:hypothetical protein
VHLGVQAAVLPREAGGPDEAGDAVECDAGHAAVEGKAQGIAERDHAAVEVEVHLVQPALQGEGRRLLGCPGQQSVECQAFDFDRQDAAADVLEDQLAVGELESLDADLEARLFFFCGCRFRGGGVVFRRADFLQVDTIDLDRPVFQAGDVEIDAMPPGAGQ